MIETKLKLTQAERKVQTEIGLLLIHTVTSSDHEKLISLAQLRAEYFSQKLRDKNSNTLTSSSILFTVAVLLSMEVNKLTETYKAELSHIILLISIVLFILSQMHFDRQRNKLESYTNQLIQDQEKRIRERMISQDKARVEIQLQPNVSDRMSKNAGLN